MTNENKYDDEIFFEKYSEMPRSINGLKSAGEWETLKNMIPNLEGKKVLDLGCGFGWHCKYAIDKGAKEVVGIDLSKKMLAKAMEINSDEKIKYVNMDIENSELEDNYYDVIISSLALHYIEDFYKMAKKIYKALNKDGVFVFSVEHPIFTAYGTEKWYTNELNEIIHWIIIL
ncbi:MAG: class I SAM-dependent methyltransferase [Sarcina sp.]